ncbi:hypothetical protein PIB30_057779 [Stylosanthes scabra]|uniref:Expansin-like EG45 domain-containing protein n=1 Tax=Stylosanthes scabra TaxID=79078 RepID=A0ABU6SKR0_9FABA|nr:hypothetical protein [Stylosanthes scabra]
MATKMGAVIIMGLAIFSLVSVSSATSGTATYYTTYTPSACYGYTDEGTLIAAANAGIYNNGAACGRMYRITCTSGTNAGVAHPCTGASVTVKFGANHRKPNIRTRPLQPLIRTIRHELDPIRINNAWTTTPMHLLSATTPYEDGSASKCFAGSHPQRFDEGRSLDSNTQPNPSSIGPFPVPHFHPGTLAQLPRTSL